MRLALAALPVAALALGALPLQLHRGSWGTAAAAVWAGSLCAFLFGTGAPRRV